MKIFETIIFILFISFFISLAYAVIKTAHDAREGMIEITEQKESRHRPTECQQYYDDGTDQWIECMGVGYQ